MPAAGVPLVVCVNLPTTELLLWFASSIAASIVAVGVNVPTPRRLVPMNLAASVSVPEAITLTAKPNDSTPTPFAVTTESIAPPILTSAALVSVESASLVPIPTDGDPDVECVALNT